MCRGVQLAWAERPIARIFAWMQANSGPRVGVPIHSALPYMSCYAAPIAASTEGSFLGVYTGPFFPRLLRAAYKGALAQKRKRPHLWGPMGCAAMRYM